MSIWNKVLVGLIGVASLVFFYMAARAVKTETAWSERAKKIEERIAQINKENDELAEGTGTQDGIRQLKLRLHNLTQDRRRMWANCTPRIKTGRDDGTAEVALAIGTPVSHGLAKSVVLCAFEELEAEKKGQYLGQFTVTNVGDKQVTVVPTSKLGDREITKLEKAKGPWVLYEVAPRDNHEIFAAMDDAQKKALLPADSVQEYLKDGKPAAKDDPAANVAGGNYVRPLRDYRVLFDVERENRILLTDSIASVKRDKQLVEEALGEARTQEEACKKDIAAVTEDLKTAGARRDIVLAHHQSLEKKLSAMQAYISKLIATNQAMAGQIAKFQLEAVRRIDQRTRAMAQSGAGRL